MGRRRLTVPRARAGHLPADRDHAGKQDAEDQHKHPDLEHAAEDVPQQRIMSHSSRVGVERPCSNETETDHDRKDDCGNNSHATHAPHDTPTAA